MERLTAHDEKIIREFHIALGFVATVEDMFPPDAGVLAYLPQPQPLLPPSSIKLICSQELQMV